MTTVTKINDGNFFEDFSRGQVFHHAIPRTITEGDLALYIALTGDRRPLNCSSELGRTLGFEREIAHDLLVFHIVFGRAVPDVSLNSPANLGYADVRFGVPVFPGDTLRSETEVIAKRETSKGDVGIVWVHTRGTNQRGELVLHFYRWAMVNKRKPEQRTGDDDSPDLSAQVAVEDFWIPEELDVSKFDPVVTGGSAFWGDYEPGERIDRDDNTRDWGLWPTATHSAMGEVRVDGVGAHLSETDWAIERGAPCVGEHNDFVLGEILGLSESEIAELGDQGVI